MEYYKIKTKIEVDIDKYYEIEFKEYKDRVYIIGTYPEYYINKYSPVEFECPYPLKKINDFPANVGCYLLFSPRLYEIVLPYGRDLFYTGKARIFEQGSSNFINYYLIHLKTEINAINRELTEFYEFEEQHQIERVINGSTLILKKNMLKGKHIFRVKDVPGSYYVSEQLKHEIESRGMTGIEFQQVGSD